MYPYCEGHKAGEHTYFWNPCVACHPLSVDGCKGHSVLSPPGAKVYWHQCDCGLPEWEWTSTWG